MRVSFLLILLINLNITMNVVESKIRVKASKLICAVLDKNYFEIPLCELKPITRDISEISLYVKVFKLPITNVQVKTIGENLEFEISLRQPFTILVPLQVVATLHKRGFEHLGPLLHFNVDGCVFLNSTRRNPIALWAYNVLGMECCSNLNHSCPINHDLKIQKYRWNEKYDKMLPIPSGAYVYRSNWFFDKAARLNFSIIAHISDI